MPAWNTVPWYTSLALLLCALIVLGGVWALLCLYVRMFAKAFTSIPRLLDQGWLWCFGAPLTSAGSSHWASAREIEAAGLLRSEGLPLAAWQDQTLYEPLGAHTLVCGPPRSWKSTGTCIPALRTWRGAVVVSDLRHELFDATAADRATVGGVYCYDPAGVTSCNLNVLDSIRWGSPQAFGDAMRIAHHLIVPQRDREPGIADRPAIALLTGVVLHLHSTSVASFPHVVEWMQAPQRSQREKLEEMLASGNVHVASAARRVLDESDRYRSLVWDAALAPLQVFLDETIASHSRSSDLDWQDFLSGRQPTSLYLCMQFRDIDRLGTVLGALVEALIALLGSPERTPRHRTLLLLDELANLGTLTELERGVSYLQGSGVQLMACVQNLPQLISLYGEHSPLLASIHTQVHYRPLDRMTSEYLEAMLGPATVLGQSWGETVGSSWGVQGVSSSRSRSISQQETGRPLLTSAEIRQLPFDAALILAAGAPPVMARKLGIPQPPLRVRAVHTALAHRELAGTLAAAALLVLALLPVLRPALPEAPAPTPVLAQASVVPEPLTPPQPEAQLVSQAPAKPWRLLHSLSSVGEGRAPLLRDRFASEAECHEALARRYEPTLQLLGHPSNAYLKPAIARLPGKVTWSQAMPGRERHQEEAWCSLEETK